MLDRPSLPRRWALPAVLLLAVALPARADDQGDTAPPPPSGEVAEPAAAEPPDRRSSPAEPAGSENPGQAAQPPPVAPVPPPAVPVPEVSPPPSPDQVFSGHPVHENGEAPDQGQEHAWFDTGRSWVGRMFFAPVVTLDRFFSDETALDPERASSFARLRSGLRLRQDGKPSTSVDLLANLRFPGVDEWLGRFRLVLSGSSEDAGDVGLTGRWADTSPMLAPSGTRRTGPLNLELRFGAYRGIRSTIDVGAGVLFRLPPGAFTRARYRLAVPIDDLLLARFSSQAFYRTDMHLGSRLDSAVEWPATPSSILRLAGSGQVAQRKTRGIEYGTELVYSWAYKPTAAMALGADAQGATRSPVDLDKYRLFARIRRDVLRRWIFVEVEPEVGWPWDETRGRHRALAVTLRVELQFEGDEATAAARGPGADGPRLGRADALP